MARVIWVLLSTVLVSGIARASEIVAPLVPMNEIERARKRLYPGGRDEEDLKVLAAIPEVSRKTDTRSIQKEVYKNLFNQELKGDSTEEAIPDEGER